MTAKVHSGILARLQSSTSLLEGGYAALTPVMFLHVHKEVKSSHPSLWRFTSSEGNGCSVLFCFRQTRHENTKNSP